MMKKQVSKVFGAFLLCSLFMSGCTKDEKCETGNLEPAETRTFVVNGTIEYSDGTPYTGTVTLNMFKTYCSGDENGRKQVSTQANSDGYWNSPWIPSYKYTNIHDQVTFEVMTDAGNETKSWSWSEVDDEDNDEFIHYTFELIFE